MSGATFYIQWHYWVTYLVTEDLIVILIKFLIDFLFLHPINISGVFPAKI